MSIISKRYEVRRLLSRLSFVFVLFLTACDFQGPWSYYPEESEVYQGIYTYGYIVAGEEPYVCFSKVYGLTENAAESFAFYDSAYVTVSGKFDHVYVLDSSRRSTLQNGVDSVVKLYPQSEKPNCFGYANGSGIPGESYTLQAFFKWDSAGHKVETKFTATATIPAKFSAASITPPSETGDAAAIVNDYHVYSFAFLGYPNDIKTYKIATDYDESVRGVLTVIKYDNVEGGESMNTTMSHMLSAFVDEDSAGFSGYMIKKPYETTASGGFTSRQVIAGRNTLDTLEFPGMTIPIGESVIRFYATDQAYADYKNTVLEAIEDSRVVPKSNIENGMGVFSGMLKDSVMLDVQEDEYTITYDYAKVAQCAEEDEMQDIKAWDTKFCRLYQESYCFVDTLYGDEGVTYEFNTDKVCYPIMVQMAMAQDTSIGVYLPDTILAEDKLNAYSEGLMRYCVSSDFESNDVADCSQMYEDCQVSKLRTDCKEYEWQWCDDRNWEMVEYGGLRYFKYSQCGTALVSRYRLEGMNSSIIKRVIDQWCSINPKDPQCEE